MARVIGIASISQTLRPAPIEPSWILGGDPVARNAEVFRSDDGLASTVLWECMPGEFEWRYDTDETIHILDGSVVLEDGTSPPRRCGAGDIVHFPAGARVRWTVETPIRKLAFFRRGLPMPLARVASALRRLKQGSRAGSLQASSLSSQPEKVG